MANPILQYGSQGGAVAWLADVLNWWGYNPSMTDVYDWQTAEAVANFQRKYGYFPDGVMNDATWRLMEALMKGEPAPPPPGAESTVLANPPASPGTLSALPAQVTPPSVPGAPGPSGPSTRDALARLTGVLNQYGLGDLRAWAEGKLLAGASEAEVTIELFDQPAFKQRFPAIHQRREAGLTPVDVGEVLAYEQTARELFRRAGITDQAFTNSEYLQTKLMVNDVSPAELGDRLQRGFLRVTQAPAEVRAAFGQYFGTQGDAALMSLFLDPETAFPELEKKALTAFAGGVGQRFGVSIGQTVARDIADTGAAEGAIWQGFRSLEALAPVFSESISETQDLTAEGTGVEAVFGTRPGSETEIARRVGARRAQFQGGGGAASSQQGVVGLGVAQS